MRVNCADPCEMLHSAKISLCKEHSDQEWRVYSYIKCFNFRKKNYRRREQIMREKRLKLISL